MPRSTKGEGSTYRRKSDGRWVFSIDLGWVNGKRVRPTVTARTLPELRKKRAELRARIDGGATQEDMTVAAWFDTWLDTIAVRRVRPRTLATYRGYVRTWVAPSIGRFRLSKLRPEHIETMYDVMRNAGRADATVRQVHAIVKKALTDAVQRGHLVRSPADIAEAPPVPKAHHRYLDADQAKKVLASALDTREAARLTVALLLGLRQSEALGLHWTDVVRLPDGWGQLLVARGLQRHKGQGLVETELKTESSRRVVPLIPAVVQILERWREESGGRGYVFGGDRPTDPRKDYEAWREACVRAGVIPVPLHGARASTATLLQELGVPDRVIADILGHSKVTTTQAHYLRSDEGQRRRALEQAGDALGL